MKKKNSKKKKKKICNAKSTSDENRIAARRNRAGLMRASQEYR